MFVRYRAIPAGAVLNALASTPIRMFALQWKPQIEAEGEMHPRSGRLAAPSGRAEGAFCELSRHHDALSIGAENGRSMSGDGHPHGRTLCRAFPHHLDDSHTCSPEAKEGSSPEPRSAHRPKSLRVSH